MPPTHDQPRKHSPAQMQRVYQTCWTQSMIPQTTHTQTNTQTNTRTKTQTHVTNTPRLDDLTITSHARTFHDTYPTEHVMAYLYADEIIAYTTINKQTSRHTARTEIIACLHSIRSRLADEARDLEMQQDMNNTIQPDPSDSD